MLKTNHALPLMAFAFSAIISSCAGLSKEEKTEQLISHKFNEVVNHANAVSSEEEVVLYNIFTPVDMAYVYTNTDAYFIPELLNPIENLPNYSNSLQKAINLGVYGADLSYLNMFSQNQESIAYLGAIKQLSESLRLPAEYVNHAIENAEKHQHKSDSLIYLLNKAYKKTDNYLKSNKQESAAVLILYGGWMETLYLLTSLYDTPNEAIASSIATQKFSCNSMLNLLSNYQDDLYVAEHLILLRDLQKSFDKFELSIPKENVTIDRVNKKISVKQSEDLILSPNLFLEIKHTSGMIRNYIVG